MPDPFDSFQLPSELRELLPNTEQQTLREETLDIHVRLLERDPELEDHRGRGVHLWLLFNAIASRLQSQPNFREHIVPILIPKFVEQIKSDLSWYPNSDENLGYFLKSVIVRWQNSNVDARATTDSRPTRRTSGASAINVRQDIQAEAGTSSKTDRVSPHPEIAERAGIRQGIVMPILRKKRWKRGRWATASGVSKNSVYEYLDGRRSLSTENRKAMADAIGLKPDELPD
jgi:hypothetical protein